MKLVLLLLVALVHICACYGKDIAAMEFVDSSVIDAIFEEEVAKTDKNATGCWKRPIVRTMRKENCTQVAADELGICFDKCPEGLKEFGPLCWPACPDQFSVDRGAICCQDAATCKEDLIDLAIKLPKDIAKLIADQNANPLALLKDIKNLIHDTMELVLPVCNPKA